MLLDVTRNYLNLFTRKYITAGEENYESDVGSEKIIAYTLLRDFLL